ncbi:hypothetical protein GCM10010435_32190 [Winogradskya consettensis]|uniref:Uncharacterized protein n=1 Tax=Winogradskya consettensis TaxID=113560 RepID=A0A919VL62_9ACTN|nr:hypothetical protein Aco04nite_19300 [Actinoplanes consettensis]
MVVAERARRGERAEVDGVELGDVVQVQDQAHGADVPDGVHEDLTELDGVLRSDTAVRAQLHTAVGTRLDVNWRVGHRLTFRNQVLVEP